MEWWIVGIAAGFYGVMVLVVVAQRNLIRQQKLRNKQLRTHLLDEAARRGRIEEGYYAQSAKDHAEMARQIATAKEVADERIRAAESQVTDLAREIVNLANRPPVVIRENIEALGEALAKILSPGATITESDDASTKQTNMDALGLDNGAGVQMGQWFPANELIDEWMEDSSQWPTQGGWMAGTPTTPGPDTTPVHQTMPDGTIRRADGQPMFQAGTSAPPPVGGVE